MQTNYIYCNGNIYVIGQFNGTTTFGTIQLTSSGDSDIFVTKIIDQEIKIKPMGVLCSDVQNGQEVEVCFFDGNTLEKFTELSPGFDYYLDQDCEITKCC